MYMKSTAGFVILDILIALSIILCGTVLMGPLLIKMHAMRERIFQQCEQMMHNHLVVAVIAQDVRQGPVHEEQWHCGSGLLVWDKGTAHAWKLKQGRLWFSEGGFATPASDGLVACESALVVKDGAVRGVWISMTRGRGAVTWYMPVYEGLA
jgi:hypothetical protein